ncbi:MAG: hypothetical protein ABJC12_12630, partial [Saprospiraceae bacterium]
MLSGAETSNEDFRRSLSDSRNELPYFTIHVGRLQYATTYALLLPYLRLNFCNKRFLHPIKPLIKILIGKSGIF